MPQRESYLELLYQYEILRSRMEIRNYFLEIAEHEVYDNICQMLSLLRVKLSSLHSEFAAMSQQATEYPGNLLEKIIRDLKNMCRMFYPEKEIVNADVFINAFLREVKSAYPGVICQMDEKNINVSILEKERVWVLFAILMEALRLIKKQRNGSITLIELCQVKEMISISMYYNGKAIRRKSGNTPGSFNSSIFSRTSLIGGYLQIKKTKAGSKRFKLVLPIK